MVILFGYLHLFMVGLVLEYLKAQIKDTPGQRLTPSHHLLGFYGLYRLLLKIKMMDY
jgi:hypothetical protein